MREQQSGAAVRDGSHTGDGGDQHTTRPTVPAPRALSARAFAETPDLTDEQLFGKQQAARYELWTTLVGLVRAVLSDPSPSDLVRLTIIHELTNPDYRRDPMKAGVALGMFMAANQGDTSYAKHLEPAASAFLRCAQALSPRARPKKELIAVSVTSDDKDHGF